MTLTDHLMKNPDIKHGPIRVVFTCDEEVGRGTDKIDLKKINAIAAYTLDGESAGGLENETFSADQGIVTFEGFNIHPGFAKDKMINAIRMCGDFLAKLPKDLAPERTEGREPFIHPYIVEAAVDKTVLKFILRSFNTDDLPGQAELLQKTAKEVEAMYPGSKVKVEAKKQYRNMIEHIAKEPRCVGLATQAYKNAGIEPKFQSIRGGTDGSRLSEMGLPTPNISTGMHNFHSPLEFACLEQMESAFKMLVELVQLWGKEK